MLIAIEGIDGSGKSTICNILKKKLESKGFSVYITSEPSESKIGKLIQEYLKMKGEITENYSYIMTLLFTADRFEHVEKEIIPASKKYDIVILDRYYHSTIAYQGVFVNLDWIFNINMFFPKPDITFVLDLDPEVAISRIEGRTKEKKVYEKIEYLKKVRENYLKLKDWLKDEKIVYIDAERTPEEIVEEILSFILK